MIEEREQWRSRGREIVDVLNAVSELLEKSVSGVRTCWKIENRGREPKDRGSEKIKRN